VPTSTGDSITTAEIAAAWRGLGRPDQLVLGGGAVAAVGAALQLASGGRNANGSAGVAVVVLIVALAMIGLWLGGRRRRELLVYLSGLATSLVVLTALDLIPVVRYSGSLDAFGGPVGAVGRAIALAGAAATLAGAPPDRRVVRAPRSTDRTMLVAGTAALVIAWVLLLGVAEGFAMRPIDGLGLTAAILSVTATSTIDSAQARPGTTAVLAGIAALVVLDGLVSVLGGLGGLAGSGAVSLVALAVYILGGALLGAAAAVMARGSLTRPAATSPPSA
jgi:hypothetical protein